MSWSSPPWPVTLPDLAKSLSVCADVLPWLRQAAQPGGAHGADLTDILAAVPGCTQPPMAADELLAWWCQIGLVQPAKLSSPTASQRFCGHGGQLGPGMGTRKPPGQHPAPWFRFALVGPVWLRGSG